MARIKVDHLEDARRCLFDIWNLCHSGHRVQFQDASPTEDTEIIIEGALALALPKLKFLRPVELMSLSVIPGRSRLPDELNRRITVFDALLAALADGLLHLLEQLAVVDLFGITVFDIAVLLIADHHTPCLPMKRIEIRRHNHSERFFRRRRIAPDTSQQRVRSGRIDITEALGEIKFGQTTTEGDLALLVL